MFRKLFPAILLFGVALLGQFQSARADIMDVNLDAVDPRYHGAFREAEAFWESRIIGYNPILPAAVRSQLGKLQITAIFTNIDGVNGILGSAAVTNVLRYGSANPGFKNLRNTSIAIARAATMRFDIADYPVVNAELFDTVKHEMGHALGFGSLWRDNNLVATINGQTQYVGAQALAKYRVESGNRSARFVPVEQQGGPGTAGAHWDDELGSFFRPTANRGELMTGFATPQTFTSETTWAAMADLWYVVKGINDTGVPTGPRVGPGGFRKWTGGSPPLFLTGSGGPAGVPEPGSIGLLLAIGACGTLVRSRRRS